MSKQNSGYVNTPTEFVEAEGIKYAYRSFGKQSGIPIVCLQHFTGTLDNWDPIIMDGLAQDRHVITIDNAGVGSSEGETPDNVRLMALAAIKIIDALNIKQCDLLGYSLGGFIAQTIAVMKPGLLHKIILVGTAPQGTKALHSFAQFVGNAFKQENPIERFLAVFASKSDKSRTKMTAALQRIMQRTKDRDKETGMPAVQAQIKALTSWGTDPVNINLKDIKHPVLIIQGSNDDMMNSATSYELFNQIPNAVLSYYPDSAHGSFYEYPEMFVDQANFFLNYFE